MNHIKIKRLKKNPIIYPEMDKTIGTNIAGPSLIRIPSWINNPLGKYYLYFAGHKGKYIRLAYSENLGGPWQIYRKGSLHLKDSFFPISRPEMMKKSESLQENEPHIASPDVHIIDNLKEIRMYYHGLESNGAQVTRVARSNDGIDFKAEKEVVVNPPYFRVFRYNKYYYGMGMPGIFYRSTDGLTDFKRGPMLFNYKVRHAALKVNNEHNELEIYWSRVGDAPERILLSIIDLNKNWLKWTPSDPIEIIRPEKDWEGANRPLRPSKRGPVSDYVCQLRDPFIFCEGENTYLLYSIAGEKGIAIAKIFK